MFFDKIGQMIRADLFFTFHQQGEIHRQPRVRLPRENRLDMRPNLAFIVGGAAGVYGVVAHGGREGRRRPKFQRLGRLNIIMPIKKHGGPPGEMLVLGDNNGMPAGGHHRHIQAGKGKLIGQPLGASPHIGGMLGLGADAGDGKKFLQRGDGLSLAGIDGLENAVEHKGRLIGMGGMWKNCDGS